jgi:hypothetical protein
MIKVLKQALDALESCTPQDTSTGHVIHAWHDEELVNKSITSLRQAIAELESQEPFAWAEFDGEGGYRLMLYENNETYAEDWNKTNPNHIGWVEPIYKHPPQRTEQNFCSRCGKRTADLTTIHTCTPPQD